MRLTDPDWDGVYTGTYALTEEGVYREVFGGVDVDGSQATPQARTVCLACKLYLPVVLKLVP